jgi:hypothetical protein
MKGGSRKARANAAPQSMSLPEPHFNTIQEKQAFHAEMGRENAVALRNKKHITTQPFFVQQSFANRNKSMDELFPSKAPKKPVNRRPPPK